LAHRETQDAMLACIGGEWGQFVVSGCSGHESLLRRLERQPFYLHTFSLKLASFDLMVEETFLLRIRKSLQFPHPRMNSRKHDLDSKLKLRLIDHDFSSGGSSQSIKPAPVGLLDIPVFVGEVCISAIEFRLTWDPSVSVIAGTRNTPFEIQGVIVSEQFMTTPQLVSTLASDIISKSLYLSPALLGSLQVFGNPTALAESFSDGFVALWRAPSSGWQERGLWGLVSGTGEGIAALSGSVTGGVFSSVGDFAGTVSRVFTRISLDSQYEKDIRRRRRAQRLQSESDSQAGQSGESSWHYRWSGLTSGVYSGITGIVSQPLDGAVDAGVTGLVVGIAKGLVGAVAKPIGGAAALVSTDIHETSKRYLPNQLHPRCVDVSTRTGLFLWVHLPLDWQLWMVFSNLAAICGTEALRIHLMLEANHNALIGFPSGDHYICSWEFQPPQHVLTLRASEFVVTISAEQFGSELYACMDHTKIAGSPLL